MSMFPALVAGQELTAELLAQLQYEVSWKARNEDRLSTTVLTEDAELGMDLEADAVYFAKMFVHYATLTTAGFQTSWAVPSGATGNRWTLGGGSTQVAADNVDGRWTVIGFASSASYADRNSSTNQLGLMESGVITTSSAGTLKLKWAQDVSIASNTRVAAGSFLVVYRIA